MKILLIAAAMPLLALCQDNPTTEVKHLLVAPLDGSRFAVRVTAQSIERGARYPSLIHLKGNVEIRTNGFVLRAEEADYDETTGEVEARGNVKVKPYLPLEESRARPSVEQK